MIVNWSKYQLNIVAFTINHKFFSPKPLSLVTPDIFWYAVIYNMRLHKFNDRVCLVICYHFADRNLENRSTPTRMYTSLLFSSGKGPGKSNWISSFGSTTASRLVKRFFPDITRRFLPLARHSLQFCAAVTISLWKYGCHMCLAASSMPPCPV